MIDSDGTNNWTPIGVIEEKLFEVLPLNAKNFLRIKFRISGNVSGTQVIMRGFELISTQEYT